MILINVKFPVKPEYADRWPEIRSEEHTSELQSHA